MCHTCSWTTETQGDPRTGAGARRPTVMHDLIVAVLSAGPVGFADLLNHTNQSLLRMAIRKDGTILKPAATALRAERHYKPAPVGAPVFGWELWTAVTGPAGNADSDVDARANSAALLEETAFSNDDDATINISSSNRAVWWWSVFATQVDGDMPSGAPLQIEELWPRPVKGTQLLVATMVGTFVRTGNTPVLGRRCVNGTAASSCLALWDASAPLPVGTAGASAQAPEPKQNFTLFAAAPILASGWTLIGDMTKFVPCSPQRFVAQSSASMPKDTDFGAGGLVFTVLGSENEVVPVTVVTPAKAPLDGIVLVFDVVIGHVGSTEVRCESRPSSIRCE
eukprot:SAG31_NODE_6249_length_2103_cov_0.889721_2_plen_338_part_00